MLATFGFLTDFKTVCRGDVFQLQCDQGNFLVVTQASYGRDHNCPSECPCSVDPWHDSCLTDTLNVLTSACNGMNSCEVTGSETAWDEFFGKPCPNVAHLNVTYHCSPNYISSDKEIGILLALLSYLFFLNIEKS